VPSRRRQHRHLVRKDGTYFWAYGTTTAMRDERGTLKGFTKVLRDSTERKHFEEQKRERNKALEEADRQKDEFLAMLAHELRNPLAPIFNALAIPEQENLPPTAGARRANSCVTLMFSPVSRAAPRELRGVCGIKSTPLDLAVSCSISL
jgi:signal transduction histidine kinase